MMRKTFIIALAGVVLLGTGCATARSLFKEPVVTFRDLKLQGIGLTGGSLDLVLDVYNPNGYELDATKLTYNLMIDSVKFGEGVLDSRFIVKGDSTSTVRIPINFTYNGIGAAGRALMNTGTVNYRVFGDFTINTPIGSMTRPYNQTGRYTAFGGTR